MSALKTLAAAVAATLVIGACAPGATGGRNTSLSAVPRAQQQRVPATVKVENYNWQDVVVYVVQSGQRIRLGMVTSMSTAKFRLPERFLGSASDIRLLADPIGSTNGYTTEAIRVAGGQEVSLSLQNSLALSSVAIWDR
ncbi:MAG TPA: hypothetical protein VFQ39_02805 [Longimicrobium sp.]|nr:hypothetical protein [Longimicrobium sp.]